MPSHRTVLMPLKSNPNSRERSPASGRLKDYLNADFEESAMVANVSCTVLSAAAYYSLRQHTHPLVFPTPKNPLSHQIFEKSSRDTVFREIGFTGCSVDTTL